MEQLKNFKDLGLSEEALHALSKKGFEEPTSIQEKVIPLLLKGDKDIVGQAQTGTGKTAAFGLPILERINPGAGFVQVLVLTPTRELAVQVAEEINSLKGGRRLSIVAIYGGQSIEQQLRRLKKGVDIVVGTPGRVIDHINRGSLLLGNISYMVLDEADEMLNMGFIEDVEKILGSTCREKRVLLFSATMPKRILSLAERYMGEYESVKIQREQLTPNLTDQIYFEVSPGDKLEALCRIIDLEHNFYGLVFCRTKVDVDKIALKLIDRGYDAQALHGDMSQYNRNTILDKFKKRKINILVATDVAARGIDIVELTHVINYALPQDPESYVHRIGRTGRAGKQGTAITFVTPDEYRKLIFIKRVAKTDIRKEKLPGVGEVISFKKNRIKEGVGEVVDSGEYKSYLSMAEEMIRENDPARVVAALLKYSFQDELEEKSYSEIGEVSIDHKGTARLFVALGKMDDMGHKDILNYVSKEADINPRKIRDIRIFDKFSFITVPFEEAEIIVEVFKKKKRGRRPVIEHARPKK